MSGQEMRKIMESMKVDTAKIFDKCEKNRDIVNEDANSVTVLFYNSGYGEKLKQVMNDEKRKQTISKYTMTMGASGPEINFDNNGIAVQAVWNAECNCFVADMD